MSGLARQNYSQACEDAINQQINIELKASHIYLSMASYFGRDNVALPGLQSFFKKSSDEEREHAEKLIEYQNKRGGKVSLQQIPAPDMEWNSARTCMELTLQMEKDVNKALLNVVKVAEEQNDPQMADYITSEFLSEQVEAIKRISDLLTQLNRVGSDGLGLYLWDKELK